MPSLRAFIGDRFLRTLSHRYASSTMNIFDRRTKCAQKTYAALAEDSDVFDYLKDEVGYRLVDRVFDIKRQFPIAVDLGCSKGYASRHLTGDVIGHLVQCEMSAATLHRSKTPKDVPTTKICSDEELALFRADSVDIFLSSLSLHWVNDLPGAFAHVFASLKSDGVFIASLFGGDTLYQLRCSLQLAELEREGGFAPHVSPFVEVRDLGGLLTGAGFVMQTIDADEIVVNYPSAFELLWDLKGMAENGASWTRKPHMHRDTLLAAAAIYKEMYGNEDGTVPATFQIFYLIGWKPDASQLGPAERGSATVSIKDLDQLMKAKGKIDKQTL